MRLAGAAPPGRGRRHRSVGLAPRTRGAASALAARRYRTRIEFKGVSVLPGAQTAADAYLYRHGIAVSTRFPTDSSLVVTSDYRDARGNLFAGFHAVLISEPALFHPLRGWWL